MEPNKAFYEIVRETSQYNKYIKWFVRTYNADMRLVSSCGYSTRREAEEHVEEDSADMPAGKIEPIPEFTEPAGLRTVEA